MNWHPSRNGHTWYHSNVTGSASNLESVAALQKAPTVPPATTQLGKHVMRSSWDTGGQKLSGGWSVVSTQTCAIGFTPQAQSPHPLVQTLSLGYCFPLPNLGPWSLLLLPKTDGWCQNPHLVFVLLPGHELSERAWDSVEEAIWSDSQFPPAPF